MNIQDIADFIDLVKNPAKYDKALKNLQEEQERLITVIETVGKASELSSMREALVKDKERFEKACVKKEAEFVKQQTQQEAAIKKQQEEVSEQLAQAQRMKAEAELAVEKSSQIVSQYSAREKAIRLQEEQVKQMQDEVAVKQRELDERLTKLRSVMG